MKINPITLVVVLSFMTLSCSSKEHPENPVPEVHEYAYSYPVRCNLFTMTKAGVEDGDRTFTYTWSADDSVYVVDPLTGREAGKMQLQSGEGQASALFLLRTDLKEGDAVSLRLWNNVQTVSTAQTSTYGSQRPDGAYAYAETFTLASRMSECTFVNPLAYIKVKLGTFEGSGLYGAVPENVSLSAGKTYTVKASGYPALGTDPSEVWIAVSPSDLSEKNASVSLKCGSSSATGALDGRFIEAGHVYTVNMTAAGGGIIPADRTKQAYTKTNVEYKQTAAAPSYGTIQNLTVDGMNHMPKLLVNTLDRWGGYDGVKPDAIVSTNPEGYWRTGKYKGRWVMVDPDGNVALLHGVNGVAPIPAKGEANTETLDPYNERFSSSMEWSVYANRLLVDYGFNAYAANPNRIRKYRTFIPAEDQAVVHHHAGDAQISEVEIVYLLRTFFWDYGNISHTALNIKDTSTGGSVFTLMFDPDYLSYIDSLAADAAALFRDDPNFIGYFTDNELEFRVVSPATPGIYLRQWLQLNTGEGCTRAFPYAKAYAETFMREKYGVEPTVDNVTSEMDYAFLADISEYYYRTAAEALRRHDPNHLIVGSRIHGKPKTLRQVHEACAKYNDIVSVNVYGVWEPNDSYFINEYKTWIGEYEKPCFITEFYTRDAQATFKGEKYANTGEGGGWIVKGQEPRGVYYQNFTRKLISYDHCIGWLWFQMTDVYTTGYGWNNKGLLDPNFVPYYPLMDKMRELHWNIYQIMDWYFDEASMITSLPSGTSEVYWED